MVRMEWNQVPLSNGVLRQEPDLGHLVSGYFDLPAAVQSLINIATVFRLIKRISAKHLLSSDSNPRGLQALFAQELPDALPPIRYECLLPPEITGNMFQTCSWALPSMYSPSQLIFGRSISQMGTVSHLTSPSSTLYASADKVKLHAYKDSHFSMPPSEATLRRRWRMSENNLSGVSPLIEFLSTGNYTCTYDLVHARLDERSTTTVGNLSVGLFHF